MKPQYLTIYRLTETGPYFNIITAFLSKKEPAFYGRLFFCIGISAETVSVYFLLRYSSMAFAAVFPAPMAEITVAAPVTASPPA